MFLLYKCVIIKYRYMFLLHQCHYILLVHVAVASMSLYITGKCSCCINVIIYY